MMEIYTTKGQVILVDEDDYEVLSSRMWHIDEKGYVVSNQKGVEIKGKRTLFKMHRLVMGNPIGLLVDHRNKNKQDNRKENLRICTNSQNLQNSKSRAGSSKYKGVSLIKSTGMWRVMIMYNGKNKFLGRYTDENFAAGVYNDFATKYFGEYAQLNSILSI